MLHVSKTLQLKKQKSLNAVLIRIFNVYSTSKDLYQFIQELLTTLLGQTNEMKDEKGGAVLSYSIVLSIIHEIIGRMTVCPCSG